MLRRMQWLFLLYAFNLLIIILGKKYSIYICIYFFKSRIYRWRLRRRHKVHVEALHWTGVSTCKISPKKLSIHVVVYKYRWVPCCDASLLSSHSESGFSGVYFEQLKTMWVSDVWQPLNRPSVKTPHGLLPFLCVPNRSGLVFQEDCKLVEATAYFAGCSDSQGWSTSRARGRGGSSWFPLLFFFFLNTPQVITRHSCYSCCYVFSPLEGPAHRFSVICTSVFPLCPRSSREQLHT